MSTSWFSVSSGEKLVGRDCIVGTKPKLHLLVRDEADDHRENLLLAIGASENNVKCDWVVTGVEQAEQELVAQHAAHGHQPRQENQRERNETGDCRSSVDLVFINSFS
jgi:hypothetical protein